MKKLNVQRESNKTPIQNQILQGMPKKECGLLFDKLTLVDLKLYDVLQEAGQTIDYCYFPNTMMASVLTSMADGKSVEVGLVGREGFVGAPVIAGFRTSATRVNTQGSGDAFRVSAENLRKVLLQCPQLMNALIRYSHESTMELAQITACSQLHRVEQRLARWLLMSRDRIGGKVLPLTHEFLSQMLGVRRASVSEAAAALQKAGLITYERGMVIIQNQAGLEKASCECYAAIRRNLKTWHQETRSN